MRVTVWPAAQQAAASASRDVRARLPVYGVRGRDAPFARMRAASGEGGEHTDAQLAGESGYLRSFDGNGKYNRPSWGDDENKQ